MTEIEIIHEIRQILQEDNQVRERYEVFLENLQQRELQSKNNKYRLGVIGVTSSGKSTLINAFLGEDLLPRGARPSSSQIVSCYKANERQARVIFENKHDKYYRGKELNQSVIKKFGDEQINTNNKEQVKQIEIGTPNFCFSDDIILVDSPGLDAFGYENHEKLTLNTLLPTVDFCIFLTTCKTNSDSKMLTVLNTVAEYEKPVIIVQNMIDSLKPSVDGRKTKEDVALEHITRIERIINNSDIKDKSTVRIIQISSIWALEALSAKEKEKEQLLAHSNFLELVKEVNYILEAIKPIIEGHRFTSLRREVEQIIEDAEKDSEGAKVSTFFEYERYEETINQKRTRIEEKVNEIYSNLNDFEKNIYYTHTFDSEDLERIERQVDDTEGEISDAIKDLNQYIANKCKELGVESRDVFVPYQFDNLPNLELRTKTETYLREKDGFLASLGRGVGFLGNLFGIDNTLGYEEVPQTVTDNEKTKQEILRYFEMANQTIEGIIRKWSNSVDSVCEKLYRQIENKRKEYNDRRTKALEASKYKEIAGRLNKIAKTIPLFKTTKKAIVHSETDIFKGAYQKASVSQISYNIYKISEAIKTYIQKVIFQRAVPVTSKQNIIIGWDRTCESSFVKNCFGITIDETDIINSEKIDGSLTIMHNPKRYCLDKYADSPNSNNFLFLVNAIQYGAALKQISESINFSTLKRTDKLFFIIQDFEEIINGHSISESFENMKKLGEIMKFSKKYIIMVQHSNPIYNMVCLEVQIKGCQPHVDEIALLHDIETKFPYLLDNRSKIINHLGKIIRVMK